MKPTFKSYLLGFLISIALTIAGAALVWAHASSGHRTFSHPFLIAALVVLAMIQLLVQLACFMHLGSESGPRWRLHAFAATAGIILIVVIGSVWIMNHLNQGMMASQSEMRMYINSQDGL